MRSTHVQRAGRPLVALVAACAATLVIPNAGSASIAALKLYDPEVYSLGWSNPSDAVAGVNVVMRVSDVDIPLDRFYGAAVGISNLTTHFVESGAIKFCPSPPPFELPCQIHPYASFEAPGIYQRTILRGRALGVGEYRYRVVRDDFGRFTAKWAGGENAEDILTTTNFGNLSALPYPFSRAYSSGEFWRLARVRGAVMDTPAGPLNWRLSQSQTVNRDGGLQPTVAPMGSTEWNHTLFPVSVYLASVVRDGAPSSTSAPAPASDQP